MYQFSIFLYCIILGYSIHSKSPTFIMAILGLGIFALSIIPLYRKIKKRNIQFQIKNYPNKEILNVNKASWWELEELPEISRSKAKKAVLFREKNGRYPTKEAFIQLNNIKNSIEIKKLISI